MVENNKKVAWKKKEDELLEPGTNASSVGDLFEAKFTHRLSALIAQEIAPCHYLYKPSAHQTLTKRLSQLEHSTSLQSFSLQDPGASFRNNERSQ